MKPLHLSKPVGRSYEYKPHFGSGEFRTYPTGFSGDVERGMKNPTLKGWDVVVMSPHHLSNL